MNKIPRFFILLALVTALFTSAFSSLPQKKQDDCNLFLVLETIVVGNKPCGFSRGEIVSIMKVYVSDIVNDIGHLPATASTKVLNISPTVVSLTPTAFVAPIYNNTLSAPRRNIIEREATVAPREIRIGNNITATPKPKSTATPIPVPTQVIPILTAIVNPTIEITNTSLPPEPTNTIEPVIEETIEVEPTVEATIEETPTP